MADITRNLARLEVRRGRLRAALEACDAALADAGGEPKNDLPYLAPVHLARAEILERMGEAGAASAAAEQAIELARHGGDVVALREARALLERVEMALSRPPARSGLVEPLTERELEVLRLVAAGRSNRQIAGELYLALGNGQDPRACNRREARRREPGRVDREGSRARPAGLSVVARSGRRLSRTAHHGNQPPARSNNGCGPGGLLPMLILVSRHEPASTEGSSRVGQPLVCRIRVRGQLGSQWSAWFEGLSVAETVAGDTTLSGRLADQSALHGVLARIRDLGLELVSVTLEAEQGTRTASEV